jgi:predicted DNA-binding transcriptional regulator AlpA
MSDPTEKTYVPQLLLSRADLKKLGITYCNAHLLRLEASGRFPARIRLSAGRVVWLYGEVLHFIERRAAERLNNLAEDAPSSSDDESSREARACIK